MSSAVAKSDDWVAGLRAGCERLVHPSAVRAAERLRQRRLIGASLAAPFVASSALVQLLAGQLPIATLLAFVCALFAGGWSVALLVAISGRRAAGETAALALGILAAPSSSPPPAARDRRCCLLAAALPVEARWVSRSDTALLCRRGRGSALSGTGGNCRAVAVSTRRRNSRQGALHWLVPAAYLGLVWIRRRDLLPDREELRMSRSTAIRCSPSSTRRCLSIGPVGEVLEASPGCIPTFHLQPELLLAKPLLDRIHVARPGRIIYAR